MATNAQIHANRENSTHSTGPTTGTGKSTSSGNSLKHGLSTCQLVIPGESEEAFTELLDGLLAEHKPATLTETLLIEDMAKHHWLADRALRMQNYAIVMEMESGTVPTSLGVLIRYHTANKRAFDKAFTTFKLMKKERVAEIGSVSQESPAPPRPHPPTVAAPIPTSEQILEMHARGYLYNCSTNQFDPREEPPQPK